MAVAKMPAYGLFACFGSTGPPITHSPIGRAAAVSIFRPRPLALQSYFKDICIARLLGAAHILAVASPRLGLQQRLPAWLPGCQIHHSSLGACACACTPHPMSPMSPMSASTRATRPEINQALPHAGPERAAAALRPLPSLVSIATHGEASHL